MQTEKQRIIWAYKILFLDVLFPLSLRKVIFMDSDQIIRADVAELWHMDIEVRASMASPSCLHIFANIGKMRETIIIGSCDGPRAV